MQQIVKTQDALTKKNIINRISDIPGGVSLTLADLPVGAVIVEGTPLQAPSSGKRTVCKQAQILAGSTTTVFVVSTATNPFKVGDYLMQQTGGAAYAITDVTDNGDGTTDLTVGTALESATAGTWLYQSSATGATAGAVYEADAILKFAFEVPSASQVIWQADAYLRADVLEGVIAPLYLATVDVKEVKY